MGLDEPQGVWGRWMRWGLYFEEKWVVTEWNEGESEEARSESGILSMLLCFSACLLAVLWALFCFPRQCHCIRNGSPYCFCFTHTYNDVSLHNFSFHSIAKLYIYCAHRCCARLGVPLPP